MKEWGALLNWHPGYLSAAYDSVRKAGGLCIADEVQSGFARTGSNLWGFESHGVQPDIGYWKWHSSWCCSAGLAVLKVIEKEKLQENAFVVGSHLKERHKALKDKYEVIGDVRGQGFMLGVELVTDRELKTPAKEETLHVMDQMKGKVSILIG
ncbi:unnamed protein product [Trifolium pratense]|uniref:Uncharacterized protein n=1 Tax=Trifolium pratense TaxID=57577 RepID=A0ACB0L8R7_TRIPR|nr:unnamed protein product [Trifolium pratense]